MGGNSMQMKLPAAGNPRIMLESAPGAKFGAQQLNSPFPKYNNRSRLVLQLRGGGDESYSTFVDDTRVQGLNAQGDERAKQISGAIPIVKPTIAQKCFIMFDDDVISISLVLGDCSCSFLSLVVHYAWISLTSDVILYVMIFQQLLEICMNSSLAKYQRMLAEGDHVRILDRIHTQTYHGAHGMEDARGGAYLLPGSTGSVFVLRERKSEAQDDGFFLKLDNVPSELYFVPWYEYRHLEIQSGLGSYLSNPLNLFNIGLLVMVVVFPYIDKGAKGAACLLLILRIVKPIIKIWNRKLKLEEASEKTGLAEEEEEEGEEEEGEGEEGEKEGENEEKKGEKHEG
jgi:hypothetical protein